MLKPRLCLVALLLFTACAGPKPAAQRRITLEEVDGVRSRTDSSDRSLVNVKPASSEVALLPTTTQVKILKRTQEVLEFEAEGEGISTKYERPIDAEKRAEDDALSKAVKEAGVYVYSGLQDVMTQYNNTSYQFVGKYLNVWSNALVSYEKTGPAACSFSGDTHRCITKIRGKVYFKGEQDPNFELKANLGKPAYFEGDNVNLKVSLTKDAYITVLSCDEDGNVSLIFPNRHARNNFLSAGRELNIPDDLPFQLKALLPAGRSGTGEILHVIATKSQPLVLLDTLKEEKNGGFISYSLGGVKDLVTKLAMFNRSDWTAQVIVYEIKGK